MAPDDRSNRVDVEIQFRLDKNMRLLQETLTDFNDTLGKLIDQGVSVGGEGGRRETPAPAGMTSGQESRAGRAPGQAPSMGRQPLNALMGGAGAGGGGPYEGVGTTGGMDDPSRRGRFASRPRASSLAQFGFDQPNMSEFERAQFSLGQVGTGWLASTRYLSHVAQRAGSQQVINPDTGEIEWAGATADNPYGTSNRLGRGMNYLGGAIGGAARIGTYGHATFQTIAGLFPLANVVQPKYMGQMAQYGVNVGQSRAGVLGTPYFSPAWRTGAGAEWEAYRRSRWGSVNVFGRNIPLPFGNPNYSSQQAQEAIQITNQYGMRGGQQDLVLDLMKSTTQRYGSAIGQDSVAQLMDPALRFGAGSRAGAAQAIEAMAQAARSARMNLEQFSQQALAAAGGLSQATGVPLQLATQQVSAFSQITGLNPERAGEVLGNKRNQMLGMALTGQRPFEAMSRHPGSTGLAGQWAMLSALGADPARWKTMSNAEKANVEDTLQLVYMGNPDALGGMTPSQVVNEMNRDVARGVSAPQAMRAQEDLQTAFGRPGGRPRQQAIARAMAEGGVNPNTIRGFIEAARTGHTDNARVARAIRKLKLGSVDSPDDVKRLAQEVIGARNQASGSTAAKRTQYDLRVQPPYDKIFDAVLNNGGNKSKSNSARGFGRRATNFAEGLPGIGPVVGAGDEAVNLLGKLF